MWAPPAASAGIAALSPHFLSSYLEPISVEQKFASCLGIAFILKANSINWSAPQTPLWGGWGALKAMVLYYETRLHCPTEIGS